MANVTSHPYNFKLIRVSEIHVNHLYQRPEQRDKVRNIVNKFDWHMVNPIKVVWRKTEWYSFDGQNTAIALRALFGDDYLAPCLVYEDVGDWFKEAELFEKANETGTHKAAGVIDTWHSRMFRSESKAVKISQVCENYGLHVPTERGNSGNGYIMAMSALEKNYDIMKADQFNELLYIITAVWGGKKESLVSSIINGMGMFIRVYWNEYDRKALIRRLKANASDPQLIIRAGKASVAQGNAKYAREILNIYNLGTSVNRLPEKLG